jgi:integrase/recombinase XerD
LNERRLREYQLYMINERQYSAESVNHFVAAAKFLYNVTLETPWPEDALPRCRVPHQLPVVLSPAEVSEFFQHVSTIRYRAALMTAYGAGLRVSDVVALHVGDIDSKRMLIRVRQSKGKKTDTPCSLPACCKCCAAGGAPGTPPDSHSRPRLKIVSSPDGAKAAT